MSGSAKWTPEQWDAITARDKRLLVAAAAGAGKTAVLVERVIRWITDPATEVDIDRLLVVTFTNAAAAEMRERVAQTVGKTLESGSKTAELRRQMALLQRANISTIHSFCLELIRQHFYRLDLDPMFRIADETEAELMQLDVLENVFEACFAGADQDFLALADCYGGAKDDTGLKDMVLEIYRFSRSTPQPKAWLDKLGDMFELPSEVSEDNLPWFVLLKESLRQKLNGARSSIKQAIRLASQSDGPDVYLPALADDLLLLDDLVASAAGDWNTLDEQFKGVQFNKLERCKKEEIDPDLKDKVQELRNGVKDLVRKMQKKYFNRPYACLLDELRQLAPMVRTLSDLVTQFTVEYRKAKKTRGVVDFSDIEHYALYILQADPDEVTADYKPSQAALELSGHFVEVLVDEYQDINAVQERIINLIAQGNTGLFMVGDVKQSIYRFRMAEPGLFLEKYRRFAKSFKSGEILGRVIDLSSNFRSRRGVIEGVNFLFRRIMSVKVGEMDYDSRSELVYGADYPELNSTKVEKVELHLVNTGSRNDADELPLAQEEMEDDLNTLQIEARAVVYRIATLMEEGFMVWDKSGKQLKQRPLTYRDIVVLLRATAAQAKVYTEEFEQLGIPVHAELSTGYFEAVEVETMLALLKIIDNPRQDVSLAAVLRSPMAGFSGEDLAQIRIYGGRGDFYDALVLSSTQAPQPLAGKCTEFLNRLEAWRTISRRASLVRLLWTLYRDTGYYDYVGGLPGGGQRQANLRVLYNRASHYGNVAYRGLFRFMRFIDKIREHKGDMGAAHALGENENVVRIMSIHKSKGLEFPVVLIAGLGRKFNLQDLYKNVLMHRDLGLGPQMVDSQLRIAYPTAAKLALQVKLRQEALAEEMRILYVAMTRAREKLILVGGARNLENKLYKWSNLPRGNEGRLPEYITAGVQNYLDWLVPVIVGDENSKANFTVLIADHPAEIKQSEVNEANYRLDFVRRLAPLSETGPLAGIVESRLSWCYPADYWQGLPARATVTGLKNSGLYANFSPEELEVVQKRDWQNTLALRPVFMQQKTHLTASERGVALHLAMQLLDLADDLTIQGIERQIASLVEKEKLSFQQAEVLNPGAIADFWNSLPGQSILQSDRVYRELPFTLAIPAAEIHSLNLGNMAVDATEISITETKPAGEAGETVLVQGIIDCLAEIGNDLLLVDYKTDYYTPEILPDVVRGYTGQLDLYAKAAQQLTGRLVSVSYLYMFYKGDVVARRMGSPWFSR